MQHQFRNRPTANNSESDQQKSEPNEPLPHIESNYRQTNISSCIYISLYHYISSRPHAHRTLENPLGAEGTKTNFNLPNWFTSSQSARLRGKRDCYYIFHQLRINYCRPYHVSHTHFQPWPTACKPDNYSCCPWRRHMPSWSDYKNYPYTLQHCSPYVYCDRS